MFKRSYEKQKYIRFPFLFDPIFYLAAGVLFISLPNIWSLSNNSIGIDFYQYWVVSQALNNSETENIYSESARKTMREKFLINKAKLGKISLREFLAAQSIKDFNFASTPLLFSSFRIIVKGDYERDYKIYRIICFVTIITSILLLCYILRLSVISTIIMICLLTWFFEPYRSDVRVGNVNQIIVGFLTLFLFMNNLKKFQFAQFFGGFILGFCLMFKPIVLLSIFLLFFMWVITKEFKKVFFQGIGFFVSILVVLVITKNSFGTNRCWIEWFKHLNTINSWVISVNMGNFSLARLVFEQTGFDISLMLIMGLLLISVFLIWKRYKGNYELKGGDPHKEFLMIGLGCVIMFVVSKLSWLHYYTLTIPLLLFLYSREKHDSISFYERIRKISVLFVIALYSVPFFSFMILININREFYQIAIIFGTLILLFICWAEIKLIKSHSYFR